MRTVIVSGMHSEMNPSPGVGISRSLHAAWPDLIVFGLDYSTRSTGLNLPELAGAFVMPPLGSVDLETAGNTLVELAEQHDAVFISGLDLESRILASVNPERMVVPPVEAFDLIRKDSLEHLADALGVQAPKTRIVDDVPRASAEAESSGWRMWIKGPNYEANRAHSPWALEEAVSVLESTWGSPVLLQEDIQGREASYCLAADAGSLLAACRMDKRQTTTLGKTWAGDVRPCDQRELSMLERFVELTNWTGGAELELVVEEGTDKEYLIDVNPRFPAWVHGATLAGINLPAALVSRRLGRPLPDQDSQSSSFTRIVVEVPRLIVGPRPLAKATLAQEAGKGHPSGMPALSRAISSKRTADPRDQRPPGISLPDPIDTPARHLLPDVLSSRLSMVKRTIDDVSRSVGVPMDYAFSMKTNPRLEVLESVRDAGGAIECISRAEVTRAVTAAFPPHRIVLNGPGKWWPSSSDPLDVGLIFADSVEDLERILGNLVSESLRCGHVGVRVRPPRINSRFGLNLADREEFVAAARIASRLPRDVTFGMHFHKALSSVGPKAWLENFRGALELFGALCSAESICPSIVDIGGGWPAQLPVEDLGAVWQSAANSAMDVLGRDIRMLVEPGKLLVEPAMVLYSRVLEVRRSRQRVGSIVVDAAVNLVSDFFAPSRRVLWRPDGSGDWTELSKGDGEILGRICMENDRLRRMVDLPEDISEGDLLAFLGVGAYDESMAYEFAG